MNRIILLNVSLTTSPSLAQTQRQSICKSSSQSHSCAQTGTCNNKKDIMSKMFIKIVLNKFLLFILKSQ